MAETALSIDERLLELDDQIAGALKELPPQQRKFVLAYPEEKNGTRAALKAGYSERSARPQASRLLTKDNVRLAVSLINKKYQLQHGIDAGWKREILQNIARKAAEPGDGYAPGSAVSAVRMLCELDGDIRSGSTVAPGVVINISTGIDRTIEGEVVGREAIEHKNE